MVEEICLRLLFNKQKIDLSDIHGTISHTLLCFQIIAEDFWQLPTAKQILYTVIWGKWGFGNVGGENDLAHEFMHSIFL